MNWFTIVGIVLGITILLVILSIVAWRVILRSFMKRYVETTYHPIALGSNHVETFPPELHLRNVPWYATEVPVCISTCLQMIAAQHGSEHPRRYIDFLMGFSYGASQTPGIGFSPVGTDPEAGLRFASPYLGLDSKYYNADDGSLILNALRTNLSRGLAVRVPLDLATLYDLDEQIPHGEVLVGYNQEGFYYYEPVCRSPLPCEPGSRAPGEKGMHVADQKLLQAMKVLCKTFNYPWQYAFSIFEPGPLTVDLGAVFKRNGESLVGGEGFGRMWGAAVIEHYADQIEKRGERFDPEQVELGLEIAVFTRHENVECLRQDLPSTDSTLAAAELFEKAAENYERCSAAIQGGIADRETAGQIATWLHANAELERQVGEIFLKIAKSG